MTPRLPTRFDPETSFQLERLAVRAWPAEEVEVVEGWLLRRTEGVDRRRCNSLLPPQDSGAAARSAELALTAAEELDFATSIQVSPAEAHLRLDTALEDRGLAFEGPSYVLAGPMRGDDGAAADITIQLGELADPWVQAWEAVSGIDGTRETAALVLSQLGQRARFAVAVDAPSGRPLGVCIGVADEGWLGLFSLAVAPEARRGGIATKLVDALEAWAADAGADRVYLQVEADNDAALAFYGRRGFHIAHSYHYRSA